MPCDEIFFGTHAIPVFHGTLLLKNNMKKVEEKKYRDARAISYQAACFSELNQITMDFFTRELRKD